MRPILLETESPNPTDPLVTQGYCDPLWHLKFEPWSGPTVNSVASALAGAAQLPGRPIYMHLAWFWNYAFGLDQFMLLGDPGNAHHYRSSHSIIDGLRQGKLDYSTELSLLAPAAAELNRQHIIVKVGYVDNEGLPTPFFDPTAPGDTPEQATYRLEGYHRNWEIIIGCLTDPACRAIMPASLRAIAPNEAAIRAAFDIFSLVFNEVNRDWTKWVQTISLHSMAMCFHEANFKCARTIVANTGNFRQFVVDSQSREVPSITVPLGFGSNAFFGGGRFETMRMNAMADSTAWIPHINRIVAPEDFAERIKPRCTPNGAILFAPLPREADWMIPTLSTRG